MILPKTKGSCLFSGVGLCLVLFLLLPLISWSGELRDYRLYSDRPTGMPSVSPGAATPGSASILEDFRNDIKDLSNDQKQKLKSSLLTKWKEAEKRGQRDQMNYYSNLIAIIEAPK